MSLWSREHGGPRSSMNANEGAKHTGDAAKHVQKRHHTRQMHTTKRHQRTHIQPAYGGSSSGGRRNGSGSETRADNRRHYRSRQLQNGNTKETGIGQTQGAEGRGPPKLPTEAETETRRRDWGKKYHEREPYKYTLRKEGSGVAVMDPNSPGQGL